MILIHIFNRLFIFVIKYFKLGFRGMTLKVVLRLSRILYLFISERRRGRRREASRRSTQRASCHSHTGKQNNIITRETLILAMWCIEQKVILFRSRTDIRDELARPGPTRPGHGAF